MEIKLVVQPQLVEDQEEEQVIALVELVQVTLQVHLQVRETMVVQVLHPMQQVAEALLVQ
tara:strand:- start:373 stop:552 length:180 start_codon:yes stop_codon:yes gene_type:complete